MVVGGNWSDHSGPRRPLLLGGGLFLLGLVLCIVAPNAAVFIVGRFLQGLGGGIDSVVLYVLIARQIPDGARPKMFGLFTTAWLLPSVAGPLLAGTLANQTTWRTVFALILVGSAIALAGLLRNSRTDPAPAADHAPDLPRARMAAILGRRGLLAVVAAGILLALHFGAQLPGAWALAVVLLAMAALLRAAGAILPPGTLRLRGDRKSTRKGVVEGESGGGGRLRGGEST